MSDPILLAEKDQRIAELEKNLAQAYTWIKSKDELLTSTYEVMTELESNNEKLKEKFIYSETIAEIRKEEIDRLSTELGELTVQLQVKKYSLFEYKEQAEKLSQELAERKATCTCNSLGKMLENLHKTIEFSTKEAYLAREALRRSQGELIQLRKREKEARERVAFLEYTLGNPASLEASQMLALLKKSGQASALSSTGT